MIEKDWLYYEYVTLNKPVKEIAGLLGYKSHSSIHRYIKIYGFQRRYTKIEKITKKELKKWYLDEKLSCNKICEKYKIKSKTVILRLLKKYKIKIIPHNERMFNCKRGKDAKCYKGHKELSGSYWCAIRHHAKIRKLNFLISIEFAWNLYEKQNGLCALSGVPIFFKTDKKKCSQTASLDRIDSSKDYSEDNVQWVHKQINKIKMNMKDEEFIYWCKKVSKFRGIK